MNYILLGNKNHSFLTFYSSYKELKSPSLHFPFDNYELVFDIDDVPEGATVFCVSYPHIISLSVLSRFKHCIVIHASDLPDGKGWSPHVWQILEGKTSIVMSAISADVELDCGPIWAKVLMHIPDNALHNEISQIMFDNHLKLFEIVSNKINNNIIPLPQDDRPSSFYKRRRPEDSYVDIESTINDIFDLLRVSDPHHYPVHFRHRNQTFKLQISKYETN